MPFPYFGSKHGLASKYPPPMLGTIIEPFAGAAGYSVYWATERHKVILYDTDAEVVKLWHRLQTDPDPLIAEADRDLRGHRTNSFLLGAAGGGVTIRALLDGKSRQVTDMMRTNWKSARRRILAALPRIAEWDIRLGSYDEAPDVRATWFVDPPYRPGMTGAGLFYRESADLLDYQQLADWCRARRGQVMVCEQSPADWLPFRPLAKQRAQGRGAALVQTEVIWSRTPGNGIATPVATSARTAAYARRASHRARR